MLGSILFASPLWAWALLPAAGLPILVHLLNRRLGRVVVFPTIRFLQRAARESRRRLRWRDLVLLLFRSAALVLLVLAFCRPAWVGGAASSGRSGLCLVVVLDRSASMNRSEHGGPLFEEVKEDVFKSLAGLDPASDRATVILLDGAPRPLVPEPTAGLTHLQELVRQLPPTQERGDAAGAWRLAVETARRAAAPGLNSGGAGTPGAFAISGLTSASGSAPRRVLIQIYSDMQVTQWPTGLPDTSALPGGASVVWRPVGGGSAGANPGVNPGGRGTPNFALARPTINPTQPIISQPLTAAVEVANWSDHESAPTVAVTFEGRTQTAAVRVSAYSTAIAAFTLTPTRRGPATIGFAFAPSPDNFDLDNRTDLFFTVAAARRVALFTTAGPPDSQAGTSGAYYLARALSPGSATESTPGAGPDNRPDLAAVDLQIGRPSDIEPWLQSGGGASHGGRDARPTRAESGDGQFGFAVIVEAGNLDAAALSALHRYLSDGGGALWVIDSPAAAESLARFDKLGGRGGLSPLVAKAGGWREQTSVKLSSGQFDDPILSVFEGPSRATLLSQGFTAVLPAALAADVRGLLRFEDDSPALAARWIGAGRLAVLAAAIDAQHSELTKSPVFAPLIHQLLRGLTPGAALAPNAAPSDRPRLRVPGQWPASELAVRDEADNEFPFTAVPEGKATLVQLDRVEQVGAYRLTVRKTGQLLGGVRVDLDSAESDFRSLSPPDSLNSGGKPASPAAAGAASGAAGIQAIEAHRQGVQFWPWLVALAVVMVIAEQLALAWWDRPEGAEGAANDADVVSNAAAPSVSSQGVPTRA